MIKSFFRNIVINKIDLLFIAFIVLLSIFAWRGVLNQMIEGEGFYYFSPVNSIAPVDPALRNPLRRHDNFPRLLYFVLEKTVGGNMDGYMWLLFITIVLVNTSLYLSIKGITGNRLVALFATVLGGIRFSSNFQFYGRGHFQWFAQRVPELFPLLLSFYLTVKFVNTRKISHYYWAFALFILALFMSHYTTLFLPFYVGILASAAIFKMDNQVRPLKFVVLLFPFVLVNLLVASFSYLNLSIIKPGQTLIGSLFSNQDLIHNILFQITTITIPYSIFKPLIDGFAAKPEMVIERLIAPVIVFYFLSFWVLHKRNRKDFWIYTGIFLATIGNLFLNIYVNRVKLYNEVFQGRYYFVPSLFVGILLATFVYHYLGLLKIFRKKFLITGVFILLTIFWTTQNSKLIHAQMKDSQYLYTGGRLLLKKLEVEKTKLPEGSFVFLPNPLMPLGEDFLEKFYSNGSISFFFIDTKWKQKIPKGFDINKLYVYDYSKQSLMVVDRSEEYREEFKKSPL